VISVFVLAGANYKLQNQLDSKKEADLESQTRIQSLTKEKDELLDLAMQRGKIIQVCYLHRACRIILVH
jgi:hypothetical protein